MTCNTTSKPVADAGRRTILVGAAALIAVSPRIVRAQQSTRVAKVGVLVAGSRNPQLQRAFDDELQRLGWTEGVRGGLPSSRHATSCSST